MFVGLGAARRPNGLYNGLLAHFVLEFGKKFRALDDVSLVRSLGDVLLLVEHLNRKRDAWSIDLDHLDFGADDETHGHGFAVLEIDVGTHGKLLAVQKGTHAMHGGLFDQLHQLRRGEDVGPFVPRLLCGHPFLDAGLAAIGAADVELDTHGPGEYYRAPGSPAPARV